MTGSHLYVDMGMVATDTATFVMTLLAAVPSAANAMRSWRIKTSQIPCWAPYRAPDGCHQYFYGSSYGQVWSPNFRTGPSVTQSANSAATTAQGEAPNYAMDLLGMDLKMCIRREKNMCCTLFQVCNYDPDGVALQEVIAGGAVAEGTQGMISPGFSFQMDFHTAITGGAVIVNVDHGLVDEKCTTDYVEIPDSSMGVKNYGAATQVNTRYCGHRFGNIPSVTAVNAYSHAPIWDCTEPFEILYHTDIWTDHQTITLGISATLANQAITVVARGLCLLYKQEAC